MGKNDKNLCMFVINTTTFFNLMSKRTHISLRARKRAAQKAVTFSRPRFAETWPRCCEKHRTAKYLVNFCMCDAALDLSVPTTKVEKNGNWIMWNVLQPKWELSERKNPWTWWLKMWNNSISQGKKTIKRLCVCFEI